MTPERIVNAMSVDVEDWFQVSAFASTISRAEWDELESRVERNTDKLLEIFASHSVTATFFCLGWIAQRFPGVLVKIVAAGHEIACHGWSHRLVYSQTREEFEEETRRAKTVIEDTVQQRVRGYRAASYSITLKSLWALDVLDECGFEYDSSIFPIRHDRYGIPNADRWPHEMDTPGGSRIVEFPMTTADLGGIRLPMAGGGYFRIYPYALTRYGLTQVNRAGQPCVFYLHPWEVDPDQPRVNAGWLSRFRHYRNLDQVERRLHRLLGDFEFTSCATVLERIGLLSTQQWQGPAPADRDAMAG